MSKSIIIYAGGSNSKVHKLLKSLKKNNDILDIENETDLDVLSFDKIIFACPEWNGSYPYHFKKFIDTKPYKFFKGKETSFIIWSNDPKASCVRVALLLLADSLGMHIMNDHVILDGSDYSIERLKQLMEN